MVDETMFVNSKRCTICDVDQSLSSYGPKKSTSDGLRVWCKTCVAEYSRESKKRNNSIGLANELREKHRAKVLNA